MAWFALARVVFVAAVAYAAAVLQPLPLNLSANVAFALVLAASVVFFESRLAETPLTRLLGALIGCAIALGIARAISAGPFLADSGARRRTLLHSFVPLALPYLRVVLGGKPGDVPRP